MKLKDVKKIVASVPDTFVVAGLTDDQLLAMVADHMEGGELFLDPEIAGILRFAVMERGLQWRLLPPFYEMFELPNLKKRWKLETDMEIAGEFEAWRTRSDRGRGKKKS
jgi:hypothetical protein